MKPLEILFNDSELVNLRFLRNGVHFAQNEFIEAGKLTSEYIAEECDDGDFNAFFSAHPRDSDGAIGQSALGVSLYRHFFVDIDDEDVTFEQFMATLRAQGLPEPTLVHHSGRGLHGFWRLDKDVHIDDLPDFTVVPGEDGKRPKFVEIGGKRLTFRQAAAESSKVRQYFRIQRALAKAVGGDPAVSDIGRIMRLPGTTNLKPGVGRKCHAIYENRKAIYSFDLFEQWDTGEEDGGITASKQESIVDGWVRVGAPPDENDGSNRLMAWAVSAKGQGATADMFLEMVHKAIERCPFPKQFSDDEIIARYDQCRVTPSERVKLSNCEWEPAEKGIKITKRYPPTRIARQLISRWGICRIGECPFMYNGKQAVKYPKLDSFVSALKDVFDVEFINPGKPEMSSLTDVYHAVCRLAPEYKGFCSIPTFPEKEPEIYYTCDSLPQHENGEYFKKVLGMFNPATEEDRGMIGALLMTVCWGRKSGTAGKRPAFLIKSDAAGGVGAGKTTIAHIAGMLGKAGDPTMSYAAYPMGGRDRHAFEQALIRPDAPRVILMDNIKYDTLAGAVLEKELTETNILAKELYKGSTEVKNCFTWVITSNASDTASKDMSTRLATIRILPRESYDTAAIESIDYARLLADVGYIFSLGSADAVRGTRWDKWATDVLGPLSAFLGVDLLAHMLDSQEDIDEVPQLRSAVRSMMQTILENCDEVDDDLDSGHYLIKSYDIEPWLEYEADIEIRRGTGICSSVKSLIMAIEEPGFEVSWSRDTSKRGVVWRGKDCEEGTEAKRIEIDVPESRF